MNGSQHDDNDASDASSAGADPTAPRHTDRNSLAHRVSRWRRRLTNVVEIVRKGQLADPYSAPFDVAHVGAHYRLRHYVSSAVTPTLGPILLVPPLMVTAEIYDVSPDTSATAHLLHRGADVWVVDFGAPEHQEGGMDRTLDDHILAVDDAISRVKAHTGRDVHLGGYSQGGLFVYQTAAYRRSRDVASVVTFGSPVDIRKNLPVRVHTDLVERVLRATRQAIEIPLGAINGLPGSLTSRGFKMLSFGKEVKQIVQFFTLLHDRAALEEREPKRRFLGGEGFIAWPGPALRNFIDEVVVGNRMATGGMVINGRPVTLADIDVPILCFVGTRDELARPAAVRAIRDIAAGPVTEVQIQAGHFGLVVGTRSLTVTWPSVLAWMAWVDKQGEEPEFVREDGRRRQKAPVAARDLVRNEIWERVGKASLQLNDLLDTLRWQIPRLARLQALVAESEISMGRTLDERARHSGDSPFFLWRGRAYSYAEANRRVDDVLKALLSYGAKPGQRVGVLMGTRPNLLTVTGALSRLGAVIVLLDPAWSDDVLEAAVKDAGVTAVISRPPHKEQLDSTFAGPVWWIGGNVEVLGAAADTPPHIDTWIDRGGALEEMPADLERNPGQADDLAMIVFTRGTMGTPRACRISNRRWAIASIGTAAACRLTPQDTLYSALPLHHALGALVVVGGALAGGTRLALSPGFGQHDPDGEFVGDAVGAFWQEVRRTGASVVFYTSEIMDALVGATPVAGEARHPVRMFVGAGLREDVWRAFDDRFKPERILEFYASTEGNAIIANIRGKKHGSIGRPITDTADIELLRLPLTGAPWACAGDDEAGLLITRLHSDGEMGEGSRALARFDGFVDETLTERHTLRNLFESGDAWFITGDLLRRDDDGDYWYVGRIPVSEALAGTDTSGGESDHAH